MQNYQNHTRYFPLHHFIITPLSLIYFIWTCVISFQAIQLGNYSSMHVYQMIGAVIILILPLLARIYALKNQDRIIRLEMRQRYFELTGKSFKEMERKLRLSQIIALRFAGDEELIPLMQKTIEEGLSPKTIKQSINDWQEDSRRV